MKNEPIRSPPDWTQGCGFQFWRCRHGCFRGDGAFGQFCVVVPEQDAVLAVTSGARDTQAILDTAWRALRGLRLDPPSFRETCVCRFSGGALELVVKANVSFGLLETPLIGGTRA